MRILARTFIALTAIAFSTAATAQWKEIREPNLGYSAAFPVKPEARAVRYQGVAQSVQSAAATGVFCNVSVSHHPQTVDPKVELAASRDSFVQDTGSKISSVKEISILRGAKQLPALEIDSSNGVFALRAIVVVDGSRVYQVAGGVPSHGGRKSDLERCVRGLKLTAN